MYRLCMPDGTFRDYPTKAQLYAAIREMKEAYDGYFK
jgi:hypothetical protein